MIIKLSVIRRSWTDVYKEKQKKKKIKILKVIFGDLLHAAVISLKLRGVRENFLASFQVVKTLDTIAPFCRESSRD